MAKKINFPLEMADGYTVRYELEEYRAHFNLVKAIEHFTSGKLIEWMENNLYEEIAESLGQLDKDAPDFPQRLCEILGVEMPETADENPDIDAIQRTQEKEKTLRQKTSDEKIIANAAKTAFHRGDLVELLKAGEKTIYLCGDAFDIPIRKENVRYIGVLGTPKITIGAKSREELAEKNITFENVELPETLREKKEATQIKEEISHSAAGKINHVGVPKRQFTEEEFMAESGDVDSDVSDKTEPSIFDKICSAEDTPMCKHKMKSCVGYPSDGFMYKMDPEKYGTFHWIENEHRYGNLVPNITERKKNIIFRLVECGYVTDDCELDDAAILAKYIEEYEVPEKTGMFITKKLSTIDTEYRELLTWEIRYALLLKTTEKTTETLAKFEASPGCVYRPADIVKLLGI